MPFLYFFQILFFFQYSFASYEFEIQDNKIQFETIEFAEDFYLSSKNYFLYGYTLVLKDVKVNQIENIDLQDGEYKINSTLNKLIIQAGSLNQKIIITTKNGETFFGSLKWIPERKGFFIKNCPKDVPIFHFQKKKPIDFPMGFSCVFDKSILSIIISMPSHVEIVSSTLFEAEGKGERWKKYTIPTTSTKGGIIGKFKFQNQTNTFSSILLAGENKKTEVQKNEINTETPPQRESLLQFESAFGFGQIDMNYFTGLEEVKDNKYILKYSGISKSYFNFLKFGGDFKMSMALQKKNDTEESIDLMGANVHLGYYHKIATHGELGLRTTYVYCDFQQSSTASRMQSGNTDIDLTAGYFFLEKHKLSLTKTLHSVASGVVKKHDLMQFDYKVNLRSNKSPIWLGIQMETQDFQVQSDTSGNRKFTEKEFVVTLGF